MSRSAASRTYLVECFAGPADEEAAANARDRLRSACADLSSAGTAIEYLGSLFVPQDELVLHVFASPEVDTVREASRRAAIQVERVVESLAMGPPPDGPLVVPAYPGSLRVRAQPVRRG